MVLNGTELGSGSIRIHRQDIQSKIFRALGMTEEEARSRFGFFLEALEYGTPPHGGIALGLDRIVMILAGADSLREVIPFPKTARAVDLMVDAPTPVSEAQLKELGNTGEEVDVPLGLKPVRQRMSMQSLRTAPPKNQPLESDYAWIKNKPEPAPENLVDRAEGGAGLQPCI